MKRIIFGTLLCVLCCNVWSQTAKEAETLFNDKQYLTAQTAYKNLLTKNPQSVLYQYRYARCCYELGENDAAISYFEKAGDRYPLRNYYLGELYFNAYRFAEASAKYSAFLATLSADDERIPYLNKQIEKTALAEKYLNRVEDIAIIDSMLVNKATFLENYKLSAESGVLKQYYQNIDGKVADIVTYTNERKDRICYSDMQNGQMNLFTSQKLLEDWTKPQSLSETINTSFNENYPFFLSDGITLYYASDADGGLGGYDIYITRYNAETNTYLTPENIGMPFNSPANDYMLVIDEMQQIGWFATDRNQPEGSVMIYMFLPLDEKKIINSDDKAYVAQVAQLKSYRTAARPQQKEIVLQQPVPATEKADFKFIVSDELVYTQYADFRSNEALALYKKYQQTEKELQAQEKQLEEWRARYMASSEAGKQSFAKKITDLEVYVLELEETTAKEKLMVRNTEINYLQNQKK